MPLSQTSKTYSKRKCSNTVSFLQQYGSNAAIFCCFLSKRKICFSVDGLPNNFRAHPLQLDPSSDSSNSIDGPDHVKSTSLHETKKANAGIIHGACLTLTDHDRIRQFIQEFTFRGLLPHIEKTIRQLNDQVRFNYLHQYFLKFQEIVNLGIQQYKLKSLCFYCKNSPVLEFINLLSVMKFQ